MEPYLGSLMLTAFTFPPKGWALCNGQFLPINQNQALFALLGTTYGGDGQTTFALPDLRGRVPVSASSSVGVSLGERAGAEAVTVSQQQMPSHRHGVGATGRRALSGDPASATFAPGELAWAGAPSTALAPTSVTNAGGSQPHTNLQPSIVLSWVIALQGIFPSQN
ncbi:phage tail protein [Nocardioides sp. SYSU DS0663]|uniref:phage tail protein n=1 Tax=Nocardioides sp. SYSU DS0663 TaxID=3416445 RepID=UPI003F4B5F4D